MSAYLTVICLLLHIQYSLLLLTFGSLEAVKFDRLDVDDQVGHFLCSECLAACCALHMEAHVLKKRTNTKQQKRYHKSLLESFCKGFIDFGDNLET